MLAMRPYTIVYNTMQEGLLVIDATEKVIKTVNLVKSLVTLISTHLDHIIPTSNSPSGSHS